MVVMNVFKIVWEYCPLRIGKWRRVFDKKQTRLSESEMWNTNVSVEELRVDVLRHSIRFRNLQRDCRMQVILVLDWLVNHPEHYISKQDFNQLFDEKYYMKGGHGANHKIAVLMSDVRKCLKGMPYVIKNINGIGYLLKIDME